MDVYWVRQALCGPPFFVLTTTLGNGETGKPGDSQEPQDRGHNQDLNSTAGHPRGGQVQHGQGLAGGQARPGPGRGWSQEHAHRPPCGPLRNPHTRGLGEFSKAGVAAPHPLPKARCLRTTPRALPSTVDGTQERCGGAEEPTGRDLDARTNPTGLLSAASLVHDCRGLRSCGLCGGAPSDPHARKRGNASTRESGTESREAQAPQVSKHSQLKDPEWVRGIPPWLFWLNQTRKLC